METVTLLKNLTILDFSSNRIRNGQSVVIKGDKIVYVGKNPPKWSKLSEVIDLEGKILTPGLVCSHNHFYSVLARGITARIKSSKNFVEILQNLWWRLDRAIDDEILFLSGMIGAIEAIKCGVTSVIDHHSSPNFIDGSLDVLADAFRRSGLRGILGYEVSDRNGIRGMRAGINENIRFSKKCHNDDLLSCAIGAHASFTIGAEALELLMATVSSMNSGIHIHVAEDKWDIEHSYNKYNMSPVRRLEKMLNEKAIIAHGVHLNNDDRALLRNHGASLIHNPRSNMNNRVGYLYPDSDHGNIALGTDGIGSDMIEEARFAFFKNRDANGNKSPADFLQILDNGNTILKHYFNSDFGLVKAGYKADLSIWDYPVPTPLTADNWPGHFLFGVSSNDVESVIVNGKFIYQNRSFPFPVDHLYQEAQKQAKRLWQQMDRLKK